MRERYRPWQIAMMMMSMTCALWPCRSGLSNEHAATSGESAGNRPNIVLIFSDDQGYHDVGCYGSEIPTPHIDSIARDGCRFTSWYSASSICTPSRYGLLTGRNPSRSRDRLLSALMFLSEQDARRGLQPGEVTVAALLADAGYTTALIGKWHLGHGDTRFLPLNFGFDVFKGHTGGCIDYFTMTYGVQADWYEGTERVSRNGYATELITDEAVEFLEDAKHRDNPFFLYLPYNAPHFGKGWSPSTQEAINIMQAQAGDLQRVDFIEDKVRREFAAMVVSLDDGVGRVLQALKHNEFDENTLVIFLTDHGGDPVYGGSNRPLRGDKATLFDGGLKVPCMMKWPGRIQPGRISSQVASSLDLLPTLCDLADADIGDIPLDGVSLKNHLLHDRNIADRTLFWETGSHAELQRGSWSAVRQAEWKYVRKPDGEEFLFNIPGDAGEEHNQALQHPQTLRELRESAAQLAAEYALSSKDVR